MGAGHHLLDLRGGLPLHGVRRFSTGLREGQGAAGGGGRSGRGGRRREGSSSSGCLLHSDLAIFCFSFSRQKINSEVVEPPATAALLCSKCAYTCVLQPVCNLAEVQATNHTCIAPGMLWNAKSVCRGRVLAHAIQHCPRMIVVFRKLAHAYHATQTAVNVVFVNECMRSRWRHVFATDSEPPALSICMSVCVACCKINV